MLAREQIRAEIENLPDETVNSILEFILFQKYRLGLFRDDSTYLNSIPGMMDSIKQGRDAPLSECAPLSEVWPDV
ncbi:MAG: hypothetical protein LBC55_01375 [Desulfovibrio sp.]|jgi:hypothetical protein|nr:hypothetical protein [Desulfovibrio sp.]